MKTTFIVKDLTPEMIDEVAAMEPRAAHDRLVKWAFGDLRHCVSQKCGRGSFGDRVNWNTIYKSGKPLAFTVEPRRGYKLFTFTAA